MSGKYQKTQRKIQLTFKIYRLSWNQLTDVSIKPRHLFCSLSLSDEINRCIVSMFKMLVGGLFRLMVAIPVVESISCWTGVDDDDRKPNSRLIWWRTTIRWLGDPKIFDMDCIIYSRRGRRFCVYFWSVVYSLISNHFSNKHTSLSEKIRFEFIIELW